MGTTSLVTRACLLVMLSVGSRSFTAAQQGSGDLPSAPAVNTNCHWAIPRWTPWNSTPERNPAMAAAETGGRQALKVENEDYAQFGKWMTVVRGLEPGRGFEFAVQYLPQGIEAEGVSVVAILSWCATPDCDAFLRRDYADRRTAVGPWRQLEKSGQVPSGAVAVRIELGLRWAAGGAVYWTEPRFHLTDSPAPRRVRVATTCIRPPESSSVARNLDLIAAVIDKAAEKQPDIICLPETVAVSNVAGPVERKSQAIPGPFTQMLSDKARRHRTYIVGSLFEKDAGAVYNTAVLIDRLGRVVGKARKVHLPLAEAEAGVAPGNEYPVFTTDLGRIGILTCWDNWFPEAARILRLKGAEMIFLPIEADLDPVHWDIISRARAMDNGVYFISSSIYEPSTSRIVDPAGTVLAETAAAGGAAVADIDLNREWPLRHLSVGPAQGDPRSLYIIERRPDTYGPLASDADAIPSETRPQ